MILDPETEARVLASVEAVSAAAKAVQNAPDLAAMKAALNRVWFDVHKAQEAITEADRLTRSRAMARIGEPA